MASVTGIPQQTPTDPDVDANVDELRDTEPLLGRPGDVSQAPEAPIVKNLIIGTGVIAEGAGLLLFASIWAVVFLNPLILFSVHPLAQSTGILVLIQSILILQPTHTGSQKQVGQKVHAALNLLSFLIFLVGVVGIEVNKFKYNGPHFHSVHAYLGVIASFWILAQYVVGFTMFGVPKLYGGEANAKKIWKYHRISGYVLVLLLLATVTSASKTEYSENVLGLKLWAMILLSVLIIVGIFPRIKKHKLGF
ncbi:eukaryotic cytochrome b561-domain-containing protein [Biscogniauxia mediterranea]|nr:eukaryotic cytochrome b561-domain-containing protein [Biscogniauxia mediterranea]